MSIKNTIAEILYNKLKIKFKVAEPESLVDIGFYLIDYLYVVQQSVYYKLEDLTDFVEFWERFALSDNRPDYLDWASLSLTRYNNTPVDKYNRDLIKVIKGLMLVGLVDDQPANKESSDNLEAQRPKDIIYPEEEILIELNNRVNKAKTDPKMWEI